MDDIRKPADTETPSMQDFLSGTFAMSATRQAWDRSQAMFKTLSELNTEIGQFMSQRINQGGEAFGQMAQCGSLPEIVDVEMRWMQGAVDAYAKEASRLVAFNARFIGYLVASGEQAAKAAAKSSARPAP